MVLGDRIQPLTPKTLRCSGGRSVGLPDLTAVRLRLTHRFLSVFRVRFRILTRTSQRTSATSARDGPLRCPALYAAR